VKTELIFDVDKRGGVTVTSKGFKGPMCEETLKKLKMSGRKVSEEKTSDWYGKGPGQQKRLNFN
jgi:hypothetical protein